MPTGKTLPGHPAPARAPVGRFFLTLSIGTLGGFAFFAVDLPLAFMLGAMVCTTICSLAGAKLYIPDRLRSVMICVLGVLLGSAFTPDTLAQAARLPVTITALLVYLTLIMGAMYVYFRKVLRLDPITAYFSASPGGLAEMTTIGASLGADERRIALVHSTRILLLVMIIPFWFRITQGLSGARGTIRVSILDTPLMEIVILVLCGVVGYALARLIRIPAHRLIGPMLLSAAAHMSGIAAPRPPFEGLAVAQIVLGASIGARFVGVPLRDVFQTMLASVGSTAFMLLGTVLFARILAPITGFNLHAIILAFSPGGLAEMSLVALSLGIETAFVATHHVIRIAILVTLAPVLFRRLPLGKRAPET